MKVSHSIRDELNYRSGNIIGYTVGAVDNAETLVQRLHHIRAARHAGTDVTITLTGIEAAIVRFALKDIPDLLRETEATIGIL